MLTHSRCTLILLAGALNFGAATVTLAQGPAPSVLWQKPAPVFPAGRLVTGTDAGKAPDHRWEGMAIGAGVGAAAAGLLGLVACGFRAEGSGGCTGLVIGLGLGGAFCGGILGGLIGGAIPKGEPADSTAES